MIESLQKSQQIASSGIKIVAAAASSTGAAMQQESSSANGPAVATTVLTQVANSFADAAGISKKINSCNQAKANETSVAQPERDSTQAVSASDALPKAPRLR